MNFEYLIEEYLERLKVLNYAQGTIRHVRPVLKTFAAYLVKQNIKSPGEITASHVHGIQKKFMEYTSETAAHKTSYLRSFLRYAYQTKETTSDMSLELKTVLCPRAMRLCVLSREEATKFLSLPDVQTPLGIRDRAIMELIYSSALRREEVTRLTLYDLDLKKGTLRVIGKGDKERIVPVGKIARYWIHRYVKESRGSSRDEHLFLNWQAVRGAFLGNGIGLIFIRYSKLFGKKVTAHDLRHAAATHMLQNGAPSRMLQAFLGHAQLLTTQVYTHVLSEDLRVVLNRHHPRQEIRI